MAATTFCFCSRLVDWMFGALVVTMTFLFFCWLVPFLFTVFPAAFLFDLTLPIFFCHNHYSTVFDGDCITSLQFNGLFLLRLGVSEACVSLVSGTTKLTAALMSYDKLSKLKES